MVDFSAWTSHQQLIEWVKSMAALTQPKDIYLCDGSESEYHQFCNELMQSGSCTSLNPKLRPGSFLFRSDPEDVARVEKQTYICSNHQDDAGPTNNWVPPEEMQKKLKQLFQGCMQGRMMYVVPFSMGPLGSPFSIIGVQITDSLYVAVNMYHMTRMGKEALHVLSDHGEFIPCHHSVGVPLKAGQKDVPWPCRKEEKYIVQFPENREIWSFGSGYGGNALLGKKCLALRIASVKARDEGWLAEHMLILGVTNPKGEKRYFVAAFPSSCGKTNLAMIEASLPGWKFECVGDDIAWLRFGSDGQLYAINPEAGFFGIAPGTSYHSNRHAMETIEKNTLFTNVALTDEQDIWWEGMTEDLPSHLIDWRGNDWTPQSSEKAAHPNARFTVSAKQCPILDPAFEDLKGVPISGIIFGGRRAKKIPLVMESFSWTHGVFLGACLSSETTAAATGAVGKLRHDPFAMLPFCGYHMGDYFRHWLTIGESSSPEKLPKIFHVNWFRQDEEGHFLWPGFGENSRILKWMFDRTASTVDARENPLGLFPHLKDLDTSGLEISKKQMEQLFACNSKEWEEEISDIQKFFQTFDPKLPEKLYQELEQLQKRICDL